MSPSPFARVALTAAVTGTAALGWAALEPYLFVLRQYELPVLPAGRPPLRVLHLSDLHMVPGQRRKIAWVRALAGLEPDLVVNTGDNLSHRDAIEPALQALEPLLERPGAFVMGSNDYYAPTPKNPARYLTADYARAPRQRVPLATEELATGMTGAGWLDLDNRRTSLDVAGLRLELVGVDDPHIERDDYAAVAAPAAPDVDLTMGVVHAPYRRVLDAMAGDGADLVLAGHTHGGQLCLPGYGALVTNCDLDRGRAKGVSRWWEGAGPADVEVAPQTAAWLHVSAGLGASRYAPLRLACRPEAALLTLVPQEGARATP